MLTAYAPSASLGPLPPLILYIDDTKPLGSAVWTALDRAHK